jgi:hypothetical protein
MKNKELIEKLKEYNPEAEVTIIAFCQKFDFDILFGTSEGVKKINCEDVCFDARGLSKHEKEIK